MRFVLGVALLLGACASVAYEPARVTVRAGTPLDDRHFRRVVDVVRVGFGDLEVDTAARRARSPWQGCTDRGVPAQRRVTLFEETAGVLAVVVEVRYLRWGWSGRPVWSGVRGHRRWEDDLVTAIERALAA